MASIIIDRRDGLNSAAAIKGPCRVATTANITLSGLQTIDGVALADGDRVLVKNQTDARDNGIRIASTGNWERSADFRNNRDIVTGTQVYVTSGSVSGNRWYGLTAANPVKVGTTNLTFAVSDNLAAVDAAAADALADLAAAGDAELADLQAAGDAIIADAEAAKDGAEAAQVAAESARDVAVSAAGGRFSTVAALTAATISVVVQYVDLAGYAAAGDGGGHRLVRISTPSPVKAWHRQSADGAYWEVSEERPTPRMFAAKGDGVLNDSTAIQNANDYAAAKSRTLLFTDGVYAANGLSQTTGWHMSELAEIKYNGSSYGECVRLDVDGTKNGVIRIDIAGGEPRTGYYVLGDNNRFKLVDMRGAVSSNQTWIVRTFLVEGDGNIVENAKFADLLNTGNTNDSSPQALTTGGTGDRNEFISIYSENCRSTVVNAATGDNTFGRIVARLAKDNGFYSVAGNATVGEVVYRGDDNACGFRHGANVAIGSVQILQSLSTSIFFGDCGNISIGNIQVVNGIKPILHLNDAATGQIRIGHIEANLTDCEVFLLSSSFGTVRSLTIDSADINVAITTLTGWSQNSWIQFTACQELHLGRFRVNAIATGTYTNTFLYAQFPTTTYDSVIDTFRVYMYDSDGVTIHPNLTFVGSNVTNGKTLIREGVLNSSAGLRSANYSTFRPGQLVAGAAPTSGTWRRGTFIAVESPSAAGAWGWVCVTSGTPGTWKATSNLVA